MDKDQFIEYLQGLVNDLREAGSTSTAQDFQAALCFLTGAQKVIFDPQTGEPQGKSDYSEGDPMYDFNYTGSPHHY